MLNDKNFHCIPPIFHDNKFITDFSKKADLLNTFLQNSAFPSSTNPITNQYL